MLQWVTYMPIGDVYVSVYEAGSTDNTPYWLDILRILLVPLRTPQLIITNGTLVTR